MSDKPIIRVNYGFPPPEAGPVGRIPDQLVGNAARREAAERQMVIDRALAMPSRRRPGLPALKSPVLPSDFQARLDALDEEIHKRGVAVNKDKLLALGRERFQTLLEKDRAARSVQRVIGTKTDLSFWPSVEYTFQLVNGLTTQIPRRKNAEIHAGAGLDREAAARIAGFSDLWKVNQNLDAVRVVYGFGDTLVTLVLGQSMMERMDKDGRLRSYSVCGGTETKAKLFKEWLNVLEGQHFTLTLAVPRWHVLAWLANEKTRLPAPEALAKEFFQVLAPSVQQTRIAEAVFDGFLLGYQGWSLWEHVGRATRQALVQGQLEEWRQDLAKRYPSITAFQIEVSAFFYEQVGGNVMDAHLKFDDARYRGFIDRTVQRLSNQLSGLLALTLEGILPQSVVARFPSWLLCEVNSEKARGFPKAFLGDIVDEKLEAAFRGHSFYDQFKIKELS